MIRIALLIRKLEPGGAERQLVALANGIDRRHFEPTILTFYPSDGSAAILGTGDAAITDLNKKGRWDLVEFEVRLVRTLRAIRPDIVHAFQGPPNLLALLAKPFVPDLRVVWGERASDMDLSQYDYSRRLTFALNRRVARYADLIVSNSEAGRAHARGHGFPADKLRVIPNGIDTDRFRPDPTAGAAIRREWNVAPDEPLIGLVARLDPKKDHANFLKAAALLKREKPNVKFVCVGGGTAERTTDLHARAGSLGIADRLVWVGERQDMPAVYNALDINTLSSAFGEGFPNTVGEAMAVGIPCVVTDTGDCRRIVEESGVVAPRSDPDAIAEGWRKLLALDDSQRSTLGKSCQDRIVSQYSLPVMIHSMEEIYTSLIESPGIGSVAAKAANERKENPSRGSPRLT